MCYLCLGAELAKIRSKSDLWLYFMRISNQVPRIHFLLLLLCNVVLGCVHLLVLLVLRHQVGNVGLRLRELHLVHPLARVVVQERLPASLSQW